MEYLPSDEHRRMFASTAVFNGNISGWDTSEVTNMMAMFRYAFFNGTSLGGTPPK